MNTILSSFTMQLLSTSFGFFFGTAITEIYLKPMVKQRKLKGEILSSLIYYSFLYSNPINKIGNNYSLDSFEERKKARDVFRRLASRISSFKFLYLKMAKLYSDEEYSSLEGYLIGLSNGLFSDDFIKNNEYRKGIEDILVRDTKNK